MTPKGSRDEILGVAEGFLRIKLQAPPVDGAANEKARRLCFAGFVTA